MNGHINDFFIQITLSIKSSMACPVMQRKMSVLIEFMQHSPHQIWCGAPLPKLYHLWHQYHQATWRMWVFKEHFSHLNSCRCSTFQPRGETTRTIGPHCLTYSLNPPYPVLPPKSLSHELSINVANHSIQQPSFIRVDLLVESTYMDMLDPSVLMRVTWQDP